MAVWFDNHCHLTSLDRSGQRADPAEVVQEAAANGVTMLLTVGCTVADSAEAADVADRFDRVWSTAGVHPHDAKDGMDGLEAILERPPVVAVGECGLDYHYDHSPRDTQADIFLRQIELANRHDLALVIHTREAWDDTFDLLDRAGMPERTVFHCFTGGPDEAAAALERGAYLSFSGIVTYKTAEDLRLAAVAAPEDRILVETDAPYLAPVPLRGKPNRPANVAITGTFLAELRGTPVEEFAATTTANGRTLFRI